MKTLAPAAEAALRQDLEGAGDPALRAALERLGRAVLGTDGNGDDAAETALEG